MRHADPAADRAAYQAYPEAPVVTGYAGTYVILSSLSGFVEPLRVSQELTRDSDTVYLACSDHPVRKLRILHASRAKHRYIDEFLYV